MPASVGLMNSLGTDPPKISLTNSKPVPGGSGSTRSLTCAYWPRPPVCFDVTAFRLGVLRMVSR